MVIRHWSVFFNDLNFDGLSGTGQEESNGGSTRSPNMARNQTSKVAVVRAKAKMQNILSKKSLEKTEQTQLYCMTY